MTRTPSPSFIIAFVAIEMNVITADLIGRSRNHAVLNARQVAIWIAHRQGHSYADLSRAFRRTPRGIEGVVFAFIYFRRAGRKVRLRDPVGSAGFLATYHSLMADGVPALATPTTSRPNAGTLRWLCAQYIGAKAYRELDTVFQRTRRGIIEHMLREPVFPGATETYADFPLDLVVRTPQEMSRRLAGGDFFLCEATEKGELLYAA